MINDCLTKLIQPKRGFRQGDPMSPLLFTPCMEYFSTCMQIVGDHPHFKFHSSGIYLKLNHFCFADDLLMFCKGDMQVVQIMLSAFQTFYDTTRLSVNLAKSSICCFGMDDNTRNSIGRLSGFFFSDLPFRYLAVPISIRKLHVGECENLVNNMVAKIKIWSSRHLLFARRIKLVNAVLMSISVY